MMALVASLAARGAGMAARLPWGRLALALGPVALVGALVVVPLMIERGTLRESLAAALTDLTVTQKRLQSETDASAAATARALEAERESAANARRLDAARTAQADRINAAHDAAIEETSHADTEWSRGPVPALDAWRVCVNAARIAGADRADCGDAPDDDTGPGRAAAADLAGPADQ